MAGDESQQSEPTAQAPEILDSENVPLEADEDSDQVIDDSDSAIGSAYSTTTSISEQMIEQLKEHGRQYRGYLGAKYVLPMDDQELERLDLQGHLVWLSLNKKYGLAPVENPRRTLDVGCGTGQWAILYADENPGTEVLGVDLAPCQPEMTPVNLRFELDDLERLWTFPSKFDYIHSQLMIGAFSDWRKFIQQSFDNLEDGGYLEVDDIDFFLRSYDDSIPEDSALAKWEKGMHEGAKTAGFPLDAIHQLPKIMEEVGFVDVQTKLIPWPINEWPKDPRHKEVGAWCNENFSAGCESMSLALYTRCLGWTADEVRVFMAEVRGDLRNRRIHAYWNFYVIYGRKPTS